jgi:spore maturation protein CgeB
MKFFEIPAAGGFQVCDWQAVMEETALGMQTASCRSPADFAEKISRFLACPQDRQCIAGRTAAMAYANETYQSRFGKLLESLAR